jgi:hypothetical protein
MASTYSNLKIELIGTGEQAGIWGTTTNTNLGTAIEEAIVGSADVPFSSADVTLTLTNTNATQSARHLRLNLTGTSGGARNLILGSGCQIDKPYIVNNGLADTVTVKNTTGNGVAVPAGKTMWVYNNGTDVVDAVTHLSSLTLSTALPVASGGTGQTTFTDGQLLIGNTTGNTLAKSTLTAGSGITITNGAGTITIAASGGGTVTQVSTGTGLTGGPITTTGTVSVATNGISNTLLRQSSGLSLIGRSANTTGDVADITAAADHNVLRRSGTSIGFGAIALNQSGAVTGTLAVANGGTGSTSLSGAGILTATGTNLLTGSISITNNTTEPFRVQNADFRDAIIIAGRAGGVSGRAITLTPAELSANRTLTLPDPGSNETIGYLDIPQVSQSAAYTLVATDSGKHILHPSADTTARTFTIPANSSVPYKIGTAITFVNQNGAGTLTIAITTDTMRLAGAGTTGSRTLAANGVATAIKLTSTEWIISGVGLT